MRDPVLSPLPPGTPASALADLATLSVAEVLEHLDTRPNGLTSAEAAGRSEVHGANHIDTEPTANALALLVGQFTHVLVALLFVGALVAAWIGDWPDAVAIMTVVFLNGVLGFVQEWRAEQALLALRSLVASQATVVRGEPRSVAVSTLVPGDVVLLHAGDRVPADGRVIDGSNLLLDQSSLTGESEPVSRNAAPMGTPPQHDTESANLVLAQTVVVRGRGRMVVARTGNATAVGRLAQLVRQQGRQRTPLQEQLDALGRRLAVITLVVIGLVAALGLLAQTQPWIEIALTSVSLAVAGIPEGLPAVVTVTLALGMRRMAQHKAVVRRLNSVETLGATSVICTDKTGTLTENRLRVHDVWTPQNERRVNGESLDDRSLSAPALGRLARAAVLCNDAEITDSEGGDPLERALLLLAPQSFTRETRAAFPRTDEVPFSAERKWMGTAHTPGWVCVKGAPEVVVSQCTRVVGDTTDTPLDDTARQNIEAANERLARAGLRVIALADRPGRTGDTVFSGSDPGEPHDLTFLGVVGLLDGPRPEVPDALAQCRDAGIRVLMLTGDQVTTAQAIGERLGFAGAAVSAHALNPEAPPAELAATLDNVAIVARMLPETKHAVVRALQAQGQVVAVTGDGVNDAPALKAADIGVAMGRGGTEVARGASDLVLTDDNFATIVTAVRQGRSLYQNIKRFVRFQVATNAGAILTVFGSTISGLGVPLSAVQLLWINLIMDGPPAMALGLERPRREIMRQPPRSRTSAILGLDALSVVVFHGIWMATGTLVVLAVTQNATLAFTTFVAFQIANLMNARSQVRSVVGRYMLTNPQLWVAVLGVVALHLALLYQSSLNVLFRTQPLSLKELGLSGLIGFSIIAVDEVRKIGVRAWQRRRG